MGEMNEPEAGLIYFPKEDLSRGFLESSEKVLFLVILSEREESNFLFVLNSLDSSLRSE